MACGKRCRPDDGFDVQHFFLKAKRGWLKPAEICEIIRNHENLGILTEPVKMPPGGSFFLYNRKELRRFRNDGYRWKKPKGGKASKEGHERLKVGDVEVLHCYYAHREENGNFHRRSYWTIDQDLTHIALVHYLELTHIALVLEVEASESETAFTLTTAVGELTEAQTGNLLGPESAYNHQTSVWSQPSLELQQPMAEKNNAELDNLNRLINTGDYWNTFESENEVDKSSAPLQVHWDSYMLAPSVLHDQLFSIIDLSPNWAYENFSIKVFIRGRFLKNEQAESCKWSCMFGEVEVPAQVKADGLCCYTPVHKAGRLPFYVTCSNRIACSEVREFEYLVFQRRAGRVPWNTDVGFSNSTACSEVGEFEYLVFQRRPRNTGRVPYARAGRVPHVRAGRVPHVRAGRVPHVRAGRVPHVRAGRLLRWDSLRLAPINPMANCCGLNRLLKKLFGKLLAFRGRERTVSSLVSLDADPEALTDPTTKHPTGETPADLASEQGHKRIAGYLAESALSAHLSSLNLDGKEGNSAEISGAKAVSASSRDGELTDGISLIPVSASAEQTLSLIEVKSHKAGRCVQHVDSAAIRIQNKFRSWKGRKDFLIIRQQIIKIQAHVRGHQVRKNCRKMVWSVGIVEKIILRWRGKGSGLRGFKPEPLPEGPSMQVSSSKDDDYDLLTEGRKKTEERLQKALARVKSMVQYPEARDQYHQLLNVVTEIQENKVLNTSEGTSAYMDDDLINIEALFDEDIFMPTAS